MDQGWFNLGLTVTLFAALITHTNITRADSVEEGIIGGSVSRATFTPAVVNREPKEHITELSNDQQHVYYFSELKGMTGQNVTHRWTYQGETMANVQFLVGAPRWRVWSSKTLQPFQTGEWTVSVINDLGQAIHSDSFVYKPANVDTPASSLVPAQE